MVNWSKAESLSVETRSLLMKNQQSELDRACEEVEAIRYINKVILKGIDLMLSLEKEASKAWNDVIKNLHLVHELICQESVAKQAVENAVINSEMVVNLVTLQVRVMRLEIKRDGMNKESEQLQVVAKRVQISAIRAKQEVTQLMLWGEQSLALEKAAENRVKLLKGVLDDEVKTNLTKESFNFALETRGLSSQPVDVGPCLAVIVVGDRKDCLAYASIKAKACEDVGITTMMVCLSENFTEQDLINSVSSLNANPSVHGIVIQRPLPLTYNELKIISCVSVEKSVDGSHPLIMTQMAVGLKAPLFPPPNAKACIELLKRYSVDMKGKRAVVIGSTNDICLPTAMLLKNGGAMSTIIDPESKNPEEIIWKADIVIIDPKSKNPTKFL